MSQDHESERFEPDIPPFPDEAPPRRGLLGHRSVAAFVALALLAGFGGVVVYAYNKGKQVGGEHVVPIIQAADGPIRVRPDDPGGMAVPDRDKEIYGRLAGEMPGRGIERLLPPPEMPAIRPPDEPMVAVMPDPPPAEPDALAAMGTPAADAPSPPPPDTVAESAPPVAAAETPPPPAPRPAAAAARQVAEAEPPPRQQAQAQAAPAVRAAGTWRVQLGALRSESAARARWSELKAAHEPLLRALELTVDRADLGEGRGIFYRIQAGPVASGDAAKRLCEALKERALGCFVVAP